MANQNQGQNGGSSRTSNRGFASMDASQQREIARMGGEAVSENREHMAAIGRKGGEASAEARANDRANRARNSGGGSTGGSDNDERNLSGRSRGDDSGNRGLSGRARSDDEAGNR